MSASRLYRAFIARCVRARGARKRRRKSTSGRTRSMRRLMKRKSPTSAVRMTVPPVAYHAVPSDHVPSGL
jgi:hypothetical protein